MKVLALGLVPMNASLFICVAGLRRPVPNPFHNILIIMYVHWLSTVASIQAFHATAT